MKPAESFVQRALATLRGCLATLALTANVVFFCTLMIPFALAKLLLPFKPVRHVTDRALNTIAMTWIGLNNAWIAAVGNAGWDVGGIEGQETAKAQTKIEQLFLAKGSLLVKEFYALEKKGLPGTVFFSWIILREVVKESKEVSGLKVEITDYSRSVSNSESAFLDAEEVSELLSALDYLINLSNQCKSQPPSTHTETQFSTKGDFFVGFYCEGKDIKASLSAGRIGRVNSFFSVDKLPDFRALIEEASARFIK